MSDKERSCNDRAQKLVTDYEDRIKAQDDKHEKVIAALQRQHAAALRELNEKLNKSESVVEKLRNDHMAYIGKSSSEHEAKMESLREEQRGIIATLQEKHKIHIEEQKSRTDTLQSALQENHGKAIQTMRQQHDEEIERYRKQFEARLRDKDLNARQRHGDIKRDRDQMEKRHNEQIRKLTADNKKLLKDYKDEMATMQEVHQLDVKARVKEMRDQYSEQMKRVDKANMITLQTAAHLHTQHVADLKERCDKTDETMKAERNDRDQERKVHSEVVQGIHKANAYDKALQAESERERFAIQQEETRKVSFLVPFMPATFSRVVFCIRPLYSYIHDHVRNASGWVST